MSAPPPYNNTDPSAPPPAAYNQASLNPPPTAPHYTQTPPPNTNVNAQNPYAYQPAFPPQQAPPQQPVHPVVYGQQQPVVMILPPSDEKLWGFVENNYANACGISLKTSVTILCVIGVVANLMAAAAILPLIGCVCSIVGLIGISNRDPSQVRIFLYGQAFNFALNCCLFILSIVGIILLPILYIFGKWCMSTTNSYIAVLEAGGTGEEMKSAQDIMEHTHGIHANMGYAPLNGNQVHAV